MVYFERSEFWHRTGELVRRMEREAVAFLQLNDPNGLYADSRIEVD